jgi:uncharacterized protein YcbX
MTEIVDSVEEINFYPFKSGHAATLFGAPPVELTVGPTGFEEMGIRDREFILYDPNEGSIVTQRGWGAHGQKVKFPKDRKLATAHVDVESDYLSVSVKGFGMLEIDSAIESGLPAEIEIFGNALRVVRQSNESSRFFSKLLDREVELYRADREHPRYLPARYQRPGASNQVAGADGMPFLFVNQASLDRQHDVNGYERGTIPINRYRANVVVGGYAIGAFMEDYVELGRIGKVNVEFVKPSPRCVETNDDQETGELVGGGMKVLQGRSSIIDDGSKGVHFAVNLNHEFDPEATPKTIRVGDPFKIVSFRDRSAVELAA